MKIHKGAVSGVWESNLLQEKIIKENVYQGVYARVENDIRVHWFIGVGSIIHGNKVAFKKYLKYCIILFTLVGTKN